MSSATKVLLSFILGVIVGWAGFAAYGNNAAPLDEEGGEERADIEASEPITLGFIGPLTGDAASLGLASRAAVELAVEDVNQDGGVNGHRLEVIYEDGQCNPTAGTNAAAKLMNVDKVPLIIGGLCSSETSAFGPAAMQNKTVVLSYCSSAPSLSDLGKYFFRDYPSDLGQGKVAAEYAFEKLKAQNVAVLFHDTAWGTGLRDVFKGRFEELGGKIVSVDGAPQDSRDYRTVLTKIKNSAPDVIYFAGYPEGSIAALKQANELGITTQFLGGDAWDDPKLHTEVSGKGSYRYVVPVANFPEDFKSRLLGKTGGEQVPICAPQAYDAVKVATEVLKAVGTDPDKIEQAMRKVNYYGVSGQIAFDEKGDLTSGSYAIREVRGGSSVEVSE
ncbi:ABC transporter substrate-binding protein [Candidatus Uhrbacteria bacterium]|nr:ABC transporter substrate-binding protein [Candidatus Uhrbacteria bacterium]